jgi:hypothetical protein
MFLPMIPLTIGVAVFDEHTRHTCLEANDATLLLAAFGTALGRRKGRRIHVEHRNSFYINISSSGVHELLNNLSFHIHYQLGVNLVAHLL